MTITGRRAQAKAQKRARICAAADELFRSQGYAGTTTQQVADVADVAAGTVFTYAASKPELLMMVMNHRLRTELARGMAAADDVSDPLAAIMALLAPLLELATTDRETFLLFVREVLFGNEGEHRAESEAAIDQLLEGFRRDRDWNDGAAKAQLITIFDAMGPADPVAQKGRRRLSSLIFA